MSARVPPIRIARVLPASPEEGELMHRLKDCAEGKGARPRWTA